MKRLIEIDNTAGTYLEYDDVDHEHTECVCLDKIFNDYICPEYCECYCHDPWNS